MEKDKYDVIVIGSGIAGMAAAHQLAEDGKSVLVLEANNYIGGRLKSTPVTLSDNSVFHF
jgi:phytoene dehydrogenase-like protein